MGYRSNKVWTSQVHQKLVNLNGDFLNNKSYYILTIKYNSYNLYAPWKFRLYIKKYLILFWNKAKLITCIKIVVITPVQSQMYCFYLVIFELFILLLAH